MAFVLVVEPHAEVCDLLVRIVHRLGHEAAGDDGRPLSEWGSVDAVILEPAVGARADEVVSYVRASGAALVYLSIYPPSDTIPALDTDSYLEKPFSLAEIERVLVAALRSRRAAASRHD